MQSEKSVKGARSGWGRQVTRFNAFMLAVRFASLGVLFNAGSVRAEREEAVVSRTWSKRARRARSIPVGLGSEGHIVLAVPKMLLVRV